MTRASAADILCIGAQRSMTSWLHRVMAAHPKTWAFPNFEPVTSTSKEAHYWDWNQRRGDDWYRVLMRPLNDDLQSLDFTPEYAFLSNDQIAHCKRLNPTAKVIYILRDPLARAVSAIRMHTLWATKNAAPKEHTVSFGPAFLERCQRAHLWDHGAYAANVRRWRRHYPDLLLLNYEDLRADPIAGMHRILGHCDLPYDSLSEADRATLHDRAKTIVWHSPPYPLDADCLHFLHGVTWSQRHDTQVALGMTFTEGDTLLEGIE